MIGFSAYGAVHFLTSEELGVAHFEHNAVRSTLNSQIVRPVLSSFSLWILKEQYDSVQ
jgi:hypothetical protein